MSCLICCAQAQAEGRQALPGVAARHRYLHRFSAYYDIMAQWTSEVLSLLVRLALRMVQPSRTRAAQRKVQSPARSSAVPQRT